jgi:hypothetical protein
MTADPTKVVMVAAAIVPDTTADRRIRDIAVTQEAEAAQDTAHDMITYHHK